jgi:hypothetical protein
MHLWRNEKFGIYVADNLYVLCNLLLRTRMSSTPGLGTPRWIWRRPSRCCRRVDAKGAEDPFLARAAAPEVVLGSEPKAAAEADGGGSIVAYATRCGGQPSTPRAVGRGGIEIQIRGHFAGRTAVFPQPRAAVRRWHALRSPASSVFRRRRLLSLSAPPTTDLTPPPPGSGHRLANGNQKQL